MDETSLVTETLFELSADLKLHMEMGLGDRDSHLTFKIIKILLVPHLGAIQKFINFHIIYIL